MVDGAVYHRESIILIQYQSTSALLVIYQKLNMLPKSLKYISLFQFRYLMNLIFSMRMKPKIKPLWHIGLIVFDSAALLFHQPIQRLWYSILLPHGVWINAPRIVNYWPLECQLLWPELFRSGPFIYNSIQIWPTHLSLRICNKMTDTP